MALSLDDRLLGEKTEYYCSSSSDEETEDDIHNHAKLSSAIADADASKYTGHCLNVSLGLLSNEVSVVNLVLYRVPATGTLSA